MATGARTIAFKPFVERTRYPAIPWLAPADREVRTSVTRRSSYRYARAPSRS